MKNTPWRRTTDALAVAALAFCAGSAPATASQPMSFAACIDSLRRELLQHPQVRAETFDAQTREVQDLRPVSLSASESQPKFKLAVWNCIARLVDKQRVGEGKGVLTAKARRMQAIAIAVAVFGVETDYGQVEGRYPVVEATLNRACLDLNSKERKRHLFAVLWLLQQGLVKVDAFRGSWAGAFGLTQFIPGTLVTYMEGAVGTGAAIDMVRSVPDAIATTALFVAASGWVEGLRWGVEVNRSKGMARMERCGARARLPRRGREQQVRQVPQRRPVDRARREAGGRG